MTADRDFLVGRDRQLSQFTASEAAVTFLSPLQFHLEACTSAWNKFPSLAWLSSLPLSLFCPWRKAHWLLPRSCFFYHWAHLDRVHRVVCAILLEASCGPLNRLHGDLGLEFWLWYGVCSLVGAPFQGRCPASKG